MVRRTITMRASVDVRRTLSPLAMGAGDPSFHLEAGSAWVATRTPEGPATIHIAGGGTAVDAETFGPGAAWAMESVPDLIGADDPAFETDHPVLRPLAIRGRGLRVTRSARVLEALVRTVIGQKVTGKEAKSSYRRLVRAVGEPAPGPGPDLLVPPDPENLAAMAYHRYHPFGIERRRAETLIRVAKHARRLEEAAAMDIEDAYRRLQAVHGIGPWTAAVVAGIALGDADAVPVGDYNIPNTVAWVLAGEPRADDERMLELLEPFEGNRGRVIRLIKTSGVKPPKFGPRHALRAIEAI